MRVCPDCGARYEFEAEFCPMDGARLGELGGPVTLSVVSSEADDAGSAQAQVDEPERSGVVLRWQPARSGSGSGPSASASGSRPVSSGSGSTGASQSGSAWASAAAVAEPEWSAEDSAGAQPGLEPQPEAPPDADSEEALVGMVLADRYRIEEQIGAGGMGLVYRASHVLIDRPVAVKVLRRRYARHPEIAGRFAQEARVASRIEHPNVVDIVDCGTTAGGSPFYVMEFLSGRSLAQEIRSCGKLEPRRALGLGVAVAQGLAAAHQAGVVHRDLKPENVFITPATPESPEQVKILDFGIARVVSRKTRLTAAGTVVGTPEYMSPEQARGDAVDARSDLYALGIVLFEALTGTLPLSGDSMVGTLTKQVFEQAPQLREIDVRFSAYPRVEAAIHQLLAKDREQRPATALDAARLLRVTMAQDLDGSAPDSGATAEVDDRVRRRSTIVLGSGSISSAHEAAEARGPATGSFAAKGPPTPDGSQEKRPSIIVREGKPATIRPGRILQSEPIVPPQPPALRLPAPAPVASSPRPRANKHLPLILLAIGAAIFAALATVGFVQWLESQDRRSDAGQWLQESASDRGAICALSSE